MSVDGLGPHTIEIGHDVPGKHGTPGTFVADQTVTGCLGYPRGSSEDGGRSATVITGYTVLAPAGTEVTPQSRIRFKGLIYDVVGDPGEWDFLDGQTACVQINLERASN